MEALAKNSYIKCDQLVETHRMVLLTTLEAMVTRARRQLRELTFSGGTRDKLKNENLR